jgi:hypothetical protein
MHFDQSGKQFHSYDSVNVVKYLWSKERIFRIITAYRLLQIIILEIYCSQVIKIKAKNDDSHFL